MNATHDKSKIDLGRSSFKVLPVLATAVLVAGVLLVGYRWWAGGSDRPRLDKVPSGVFIMTSSVTVDDVERISDTAVGSFDSNRGAVEIKQYPNLVGVAALPQGHATQLWTDDQWLTFPYGNWAAPEVAGRWIQNQTPDPYVGTIPGPAALSTLAQRYPERMDSVLSSLHHSDAHQLPGVVETTSTWRGKVSLDDAEFITSTAAPLLSTSIGALQQTLFERARSEYPDESDGDARNTRWRELSSGVHTDLELLYQGAKLVGFHIRIDPRQVDDAYLPITVTVAFMELGAGEVAEMPAPVLVVSAEEMNAITGAHSATKGSSQAPTDPANPGPPLTETIITEDLSGRAPMR